jgi:dolichol-phosphate mannosyltransferase
MKIVLLVPTFNERDNIKPLIESLQGVFMKMNHDLNILVADDQSPDRTID